MNTQTQKAYHTTGIILIILGIGSFIKTNSLLVISWLKSINIAEATSQVVGSGWWGYLIIITSFILANILAIWVFIVGLTLIKRKYTSKLLYLMYAGVISLIMIFLVYIPVGKWRIINLIVAAIIYFSIIRGNNPFAQFMHGKEINLKKK